MTSVTHDRPALVVSASPRHIPVGRWALNGMAALALGYILLPLVLVTWLAFFRQEIPSFPPEGYSLKWFGAVLNNKSFVGGFLLSFQTGVVATLIGLALAVPASLAIARRRFRGRGMVNALLLMPLIVPGVVLGPSIYVFQIETEIATGLPLLGNTAGLIAAHVLIVVPWAARLVSASLAGFDPAIEEAAKNLGATPWTTFWRITLPAIRWGVAYGIVLSVARCIGEFGAVSVVSGKISGETETLTLLVEERFQNFDLAGAYAASALLALIALGTLLAMTKINPRRDDE
jgi:putative spermidine/putrescine transport system permease protein